VLFRLCSPVLARASRYAALALLKLADNFENHVAIAKAGGLLALLKLGRGGQVDEVSFRLRAKGQERASRELAESW